MHADVWFGAILWVMLICYWLFYGDSIKERDGKAVRSRFKRTLVGMASIVIFLALLSPFDLPFAGAMWRALVYVLHLVFSFV